jgi:prepilin-type N-terminal cleavage/methylation domain-containing protein
MSEAPKKKGYTFLELIIAMAVVAILMGLGFAGIATLQMSQRNTERRKGIESINLEVIAFQGDTGKFPARIEINPNTGLVKICEISNLGCTTGIVKNTTVKGAALPISNLPASTPAGSAYCYVITGASYSLAVGLEGGASAFDMGNSATKCTPNNNDAADAMFIN